MRKLFFSVVSIFYILSTPLMADLDSLQVQAIRSLEMMSVDGLLTEAIWKNGNAIAQFTQRDPIEGATPSERTEVRVAYDDNALYIGARMYDSSPDSIIARLARRDASVSSDYFVFFIDPYNDRRSGFYFGVTAAGTLLDGVMMNDEWDDDSWDGVWEVRTNMDQYGWTAEFRIPYSQLRFHNKEQYVWGVNFKRNIQRKNETNYIVFTPKDGSGFVSRFVKMIGIEKISPTRQIEFLPYVRSKAEFTHPDAGDPFNDGSRFLPGMGADIKIGIGNNLTLDATVNPDFGQVEVDPAVVNLSDVETFYREKRPFFIEGSSIFNFGRGGASSFYGLSWPEPDFFYSRRIGGAPRGSLPDYDFAKYPEGVKIIGAGKLTGKTNSSWNVGALGAVTARETADFEYNELMSTSEIEPLAFYGVFRGQKDFNEGRQGIGLLSTVVNRNFENTCLRDELNSESYTLGLDGWTFFDKDKVWVFAGWAGLSHVKGNVNRIIDLQRSSAHYLQRPDADHVAVDSSAPSMTGWSGRFSINKQKGNALFNMALGAISPKFDSNDLGFIWRTDVINGHIMAGYKWTKPARFTRHAEFHLALFGSYDFGGNSTWKGIFQNGYVKLLNYQTINYFWAYNPESYSNRLTRGGPLALNPAGYEADISWSSDNRNKWVFGLDFYGGNYPSTKYVNVRPSVEWNPADNVSLSISPQYMKDRTMAHYVDTFDDPTATATYGKRYVFAEIEQNILSASIRLNWTFTPKLSLQLYAQPLIASGDYFDFKELARPKTFDFNIYGEGQSTFYEQTMIADPDGPDGPAAPIELENPDFNYKSLRGNAVMRWEYSPGSTLYFVWTQRRSDVEEIGEFRFKKSFDRLFDAEADNIFMVKMTYWFGL